MRAKESPIQRALGMAVFSVLIITALAWTGVYTLAGSGGQNKNADAKKEKIEDVTEREGDTIKAKSGYELFKRGNKLYARRFGSDVKAPPGANSSISCTCDNDGICFAVTNGKTGQCVKSSTNPCSHCRISYTQ